MKKKFKHITDKVEKYYDAQEDLEYMPDVYAAGARRSSLLSNLLLVVIITFLVVFFIWASFARLDEVTRGFGRVIPSSQVQVIQHLEGGIIAEILVREGQVVQKEQVLLRVENRMAEADYQKTYQKYLHIGAKITRLVAEIENIPLEFSPELAREVPEAVNNERNLYNTHLDQQRSQASILQSQIDQRRQELSRSTRAVQNLRRSLDLSQQQLNLIAPVVASGAAPKVDLLNAQREVNDFRSQLDGVRLNIPKLKSAIQEAQSRLKEHENTTKAQAQAELNQAKSEYASLEEFIKVGQDRVDRTDIKSPVRGTVKDIKVTTIGGVIRPGQNLLEIVPLGDTLLIEAKVRPTDIAFISPQQKAKVKITAYDFAMYGGLDAVVEDISADTITDERGGDFYRIRLRTDKNYLGTAENPLQIIPGMTATVDILTGKKTVLQYLIKPIVRARLSALQER